MFHAAVLTIVLALAMSGPAAPLCAVWCGMYEVKADHCQRAGISVLPVRGCADATTVSAFVRDESRRGLTAPDSRDGIAVHASTSGARLVLSRLGYQPVRRTIPDARPLEVALRI